MLLSTHDYIIVHLWTLQKPYASFDYI